ncbi:DUF1810 domain-containing protein [Anditalea andensis]|uniref:Calpastatin n=1 Tax=Anditalea andensis TaxID=1048983 RepID=A0A074KXQ3_9BACT|nr:DUF1810 domain-containing protein [Anditalea andensis]KEO72990.1 calpastatin [Anditalea andensis]
MNSAPNMDRFIKAQQNIYAQVVTELKAGKKRTHWMWFIFPQIQGLGSSPMAVKYGLNGIEEAMAYYAHPILGVRLKECTQILLSLENPDVDAIFGYPDHLKLKSSLTLFSIIAEDSVFNTAISRLFQGQKDELTLRLINGENPHKR